MKNKSVPFSAEEIQDALSDETYLEELRDIEREYCERVNTIVWVVWVVFGVVGGLIFIKMVWG